jgi:muconolactone delta-isomerase
MVEAGGVETNSGTENAQLIDFSRRTKRQKLEKRGQLERIWNTASHCQNESLVDLPYLCFVPDWRAVAR